jgi:hypothetical protein
MRYSCLVIGVLFARRVLTALLTGRLTGFPVPDRSDAGAPEPARHGLLIHDSPGTKTTWALPADL